MTGGRKWEARERAGTTQWTVMEGDRVVVEHLTEPEAHAIAGCMETKADMDRAMALLKKISEQDPVDAALDPDWAIRNAAKFLYDIKRKTPFLWSYNEGDEG